MMITQKQITCINKPDRYSTNEHITHVGGPWGKITVEEVISNIEKRVCDYYVSVDGFTIDVTIVNGVNRKYIKTRPDSTGKDNLLALPECH